MPKMILAFLGLTITSLIVSGYIALFSMKDLGQYSLENSTHLGDSAITDSTNALESLGEKLLEQKTRDISVQCEIYIKTHPHMSIGDLQKNEEFRKIAVQLVGKTGYTLMYEKTTGIMRLHPNHEFENYSMHNLSKTLPSFWEIFYQSMNGSVLGGYYTWKDPDGSIRQKYMFMVPVKDTKYMVAATTYIDEFSKPAEETRKKISMTTKNIGMHINNRIDNTRDSFVNFMIILIILATVLSFILSRMITMPILTLRDGVKALGLGNLEHKVSIHTNDEFEELAESFNKMTADLTDYMERLHCTTAEQERLLKELEIARGIQQSILPQKAPDIKGAKFAATNIPAREVGGDFYDFVPVAEDFWGLTIADVSGKGMPAAIFMGLSRTIVRASTTANLSAKSAITHANELICRDSTSGMFVTLFYAILDTINMKLHYINAGHNPPLLFREGENNIIELEAKGIPLGVAQDIEVEEKEISLLTDDILVLYTDGVTEAINENEEEFGKSRLIQLINDSRLLNAEEIVTTVQNEIISFAGNQPQYDDITLMILKVTG